MRLSRAQIFRLDGIFETVEEGRLGVSPLLATMEPLEAVVIEVAPKSDARWKGAVAERSQCAKTGNFVDVANDEDVTSARSLFTGQGGEGLGVEGIASEPFVFPGIARGER